MQDTPPATLEAIRKNFHGAIRGRAERVIVEHNASLPGPDALPESANEAQRFPVPGMCGGFNYRLEIEGVNSKLTCTSWRRVVGGSGQRHAITAAGARLVETGFA